MSIGATGLQIPYGIQPTNALPVDTWSGPFYGTSVTNACAVALTSIPQSVRFQSMEVRLIAGGQAYKYWFKGGVNDSNLIDISTSGATGATGPTGNTGATGPQGATGIPADIIPTVTNYLSTNNVQISALSVKGSILSGNNVELTNIFSNTKYLFNDNNSLDKTQRYVYYGNGYQGIVELDGADVAFDLDAPWTRWFVNLGNGPISGTNYDQGFEIYVYPNEIKKINYNGTSYSVLESYNLSNSQQWDSVYTTVQSNSANWEISNIDGGSSTSVYLLNQNINGGFSNTF